MQNVLFEEMVSVKHRGKCSWLELAWETYKVRLCEETGKHSPNPGGEWQFTI